MEFPGEKLVIKLWETITEKGIGNFLAPWQARRMGEARSDLRKREIIKIAEAEKEVEAIRNRAYLDDRRSKKGLEGPSNEKQDERNEPVLDFAEMEKIAKEIERSESLQKEINVNKAVFFAEEELSQDPSEPSESKVDDDWLSAWREYASRVSSEELQQLWGRLLAGEVKQKGSYSLRTMDFVKNLSKEDAEIIAKVAPFVIYGRVFRNKDEILKENGVTFDTLLFLQEIGLLSGVESPSLITSWNSVQSDRYIAILLGPDRAIHLEHEDVNSKASAEVYILTKIGQEVMSLASVSSNEKYIRSVAEDFEKKGYTVTIGNWQHAENDMINFYDQERVGEE